MTIENQAEAKTPTRRTTKAEKNKRIEKITEMLTQGFTRAQILQFSSEKTNWEVSERTIDTYIAEATIQIEMLAEAASQYELGRALARLDDLYRRNMAIQDYKAALQVQRERSKLLGIYAPDKVEQQGAIELVVRYAEQNPSPNNDPQAA